MQFIIGLCFLAAFLLIVARVWMIYARGDERRGEPGWKMVYGVLALICVTAAFKAFF